MVCARVTGNLSVIRCGKVKPTIRPEPQSFGSHQPLLDRESDIRVDGQPVQVEPKIKVCFATYSRSRKGACGDQCSQIKVITGLR
jgi:hypothetical protein